MGRPTALTADVALAIVESVSEGCTVEDAARAAGVGVSSVYRWQQQGASEDPEHATYREFRDALTRARGAARRAVQGAMYRAATEDRDTKAAALWLELTGRNLDALEGTTARDGRQLDEMEVQAILALIDDDPAETPVAPPVNGNGNGNGRHH